MFEYPTINLTNLKKVIMMNSLYTIHILNSKLFLKLKMALWYAKNREIKYIS